MTDERPKLLARNAREPEVLEAKIDDRTVLFSHRKVDVSLTVTSNLVMSNEAASAMIATAHSQYAIPAQEETNRAKEVTKRFKYRVISYPIVLGLGMIAMCFRPEVAQWIALMVIALLGTVEGLQIVDRLTTKQLPPKEGQ